MLDQRGQLLRAALGFAGLPRPHHDRSLRALRTWLDSWAGIGRIAVGMAHQGFDLQLTRYDERGWRATFYTTGLRIDRFSSRRELCSDAVTPPFSASKVRLAGFWIMRPKAHRSL